MHFAHAVFPLYLFSVCARGGGSLVREAKAERRTQLVCMQFSIAPAGAILVLSSHLETRWPIEMKIGA
jgi:hypothetical protein